MNKSCASCFYMKQYKGFGKPFNVCELSNRVLGRDIGSTCEYYNKNLSSEKMCYSCKHFLGGTDWGLSCAKQYLKIVHGLDDACDLYEAKER